MLNREKLKVLKPLTLETQQGFPPSPLLFNIVLEELAKVISGKYKGNTQKKSKEHREEIKLYLFSDDIILYIKDFKDSAGKFLLLLNTFSKVAEYKLT